MRYTWSCYLPLFYHPTNFASIGLVLLFLFYHLRCPLPSTSLVYASHSLLLHVITLVCTRGELETLRVRVHTKSDHELEKQT